MKSNKLITILKIYTKQFSGQLIGCGLMIPLKCDIKQNYMRKMPKKYGSYGVITLREFNVAES